MKGGSKCVDPGDLGPSRSTRRSGREKVDYKNLNETGKASPSKKDALSEVPDDDDAAARMDIDEMLDSDFRPSEAANDKRQERPKRKRKVNFQEDFSENEDDEEEKQVLFNTPFKKFAKRRVPIMDKSVASIPKTKRRVVTESYENCKDQLCVVCAKELPIEELYDYANIYTDTTTNGKSLLEMMKAIVKQDIQPSTFGVRLCHGCLKMLNNIENHHFQYRRATDSFLDTFISGQQILDCDATAASDTSDIIKGITSYLNLDKIKIKVVDSNSNNFNALAAAYDFQVTPSMICRGSIVPREKLPEPDVSTADKDAITVVLPDETTAVVENNMSLEAAEMTTNEDENPSKAAPVLYITQLELIRMTKSVSKSTLFLVQEELESMVSKLLLGLRVKQQSLLSVQIAEEYKRQLPGSKSSFTCSDCAASFDFLNILSNHIHSTHSEEDETGPDSQMTKRRGSSSSNVRTGEVPTLDKPFQCENCDKCFSEYGTLSNHIEHYHGFSRYCNVDGCDNTVKYGSIQDFVQHYVNHAQKDFKVPSDFKSKTKITIPCPMCNVNIQNVWKYFEHTFLHDKEPRFKCPSCGKTLHKVQNFKDHLQKHHSVKDRTKSMAVSEELDTGREEWAYLCDICKDTFTSTTALQTHLANAHTNSDCYLCKQPFENWEDLQKHLKEEHPESVIIVQTVEES